MEKQESKGRASGLTSSQVMGLDLLLLHWVCQKLSIFWQYLFCEIYDSVICIDLLPLGAVLYPELSFLEEFGPL